MLIVINQSVFNGKLLDSACSSMTIFFELRSTDYHSYHYIYTGTVYFYRIARISEDFH